MLGLCSGGPLVGFLGGPPYLLRVDVAGEARHDPPVRAAQDDDARVAYEVEAVAGGQLRVGSFTRLDGYRGARVTTPTRTPPRTRTSRQLGE